MHLRKPLGQEKMPVCTAISLLATVVVEVVALVDYRAPALADRDRSQMCQRPFNATATARTIQAKVSSAQQSIHHSLRRINDAGIVNSRTATYDTASGLHLGRLLSRPRPTAYQKTAARQRWRHASRKSKGVLTCQLSQPFANTASAMGAEAIVAGIVPTNIA
jgi:hypothetical protein